MHLRRQWPGLLVVASVATVGALLSAIFPLTQGFSAGDSLDATVAAGVTAAVALGWVPLGESLVRGNQSAASAAGVEPPMTR